MKNLFLLLIILTFSNYVFAFSLGNIFVKEEKRTSNIRCKVEYTRLNLITGIETFKKHTAQFDLDRMSKEAKEQDICHFSIQYLAVKINEWLNKSRINIIVNMTINNCKKKITDVPIWKVWSSGGGIWGKYKSCPDEFNIELFNEIENKQWGFNVHKDRLIKDYEEEFKN
jgi:hypothetical protein